LAGLINVAQGTLITGQEAGRYGNAHPSIVPYEPFRAADGSPISSTQLLVVGIGSTLGILLQAAVMLPAMRRTGFRWHWRFGWDPRLTSFGGLAAWVIGYVVVSQIGLTVILRVAFSATDGGPSIYSNAWLLIQVPYGVLGVSLLTALMPRMSAAAANGRLDQVVDDLSLGSRLSTVTLLPVSVILTVFGSQLGVAMFSVGRAGGSSAEALGAALSASAFGLLPMAVVMLQLRVFYAMADARTPTLIMVIMTAVKVPLAYLCPVLLPPGQVVLGLAGVNAFGFVVGLVVGDVWLRRRIGRLDTRRVLRTVLLTGLAVPDKVAGNLAVRDDYRALQRLVDADQRPEPGMLRLQRHTERRRADPLEAVDRDVNGEVDQGDEPEPRRDNQDQRHRHGEVHQTMRQQRQRPAGLLILADRHPGILQNEIGDDVLHGEKQHPSHQRANRDRRRHRRKQQS